MQKRFFYIRVRPYLHVHGKPILFGKTFGLRFENLIDRELWIIRFCEKVIAIRKSERDNCWTTNVTRWRVMNEKFEQLTPEEAAKKVEAWGIHAELEHLIAIDENRAQKPSSER